MKYIIANWKMNMSMGDILKWEEQFDLKDSLEKVKIIVAPSQPHLLPVAEMFKNTAIETASQDVSLEKKGAHTGETGAFQIKEICAYSIVGHSERKEPASKVIKKIKRCSENGIIPIVCFVEPEKIKKYIKPGVIFAWEDPANISKEGVYKEKDPQEIIEGVKEIRKILPKNEPLIYGGSVNRQNVGNLVNIDGLDGVLAGNASLDPEHFAEIVRAYL